MARITNIAKKEQYNTVHKIMARYGICAPAEIARIAINEDGIKIDYKTVQKLVKQISEENHIRLMGIARDGYLTDVYNRIDIMKKAMEKTGELLADDNNKMKELSRAALNNSLVILVKEITLMTNNLALYPYLVKRVKSIDDNNEGWKGIGLDIDNVNAGSVNSTQQNNS